MKVSNVGISIQEYDQMTGVEVRIAETGSYKHDNGQMVPMLDVRANGYPGVSRMVFEQVITRYLNARGFLVVKQPETLKYIDAPREGGQVPA